METTNISLRRRLIWASSFWICAGFVIAFLLLSNIFKAQVTQQFYEELDIHVLELERLVQDRDGGDLAMGEHFSDPRYDVAKSGYYWLVRDGDENKLESPSFDGFSLDLEPDPHPPGASTERHKVDGPTGTLLFVERSINPHPSSGQLRQYIVGTDKRHLDAMVAEFNTLLGISLSVFALVLVGSAIMLLRFALSPFTKLRTSLSNVRAGDTRNLEGTFPQEVQPLVDEFNGLLISMGDMLQRARAGAGNLAHGLKSPLTIISSEAFELSERGQDKSATAILEQSRIMQRHIDHHLARARASIVARMPGMRTPLESELSQLLRALETLHKDKPVLVETNIDPELCLTTDAQDLKEILGNVIENAFKFASSSIAISARRSPDQMVAITIEDDGPGLPLEAREMVFGIGNKWDELESGHGLGLAIVKEIVELYGGEIRLDDAPGGGLRVDITLPSCE
tara:strand:+ start:32018 stop:33382 length:1365 start_codon:yes stop_codon:yes gene_type:complete